MSRQLSIGAVEQRDAHVSACGIYRYSLLRRWRPGPLMCLAGLNPSIADAEIDDPTIRREVGFAKREGFAGIWKVNAFALRATDPDDLLSHADPIGIGNWDALRDVAQSTPDDIGVIVVAWGAAHPKLRAHIARVERVLREMGRELHCLGRTKDGSPRHPLYLPADVPLEVFQ
jgi:hypothetical protein